jgi:hypothetical protein
MGKSVVREGASERKKERQDAAKSVGQRIADVVERMLESPPIIEKKVGRHFDLRCDGDRYDVLVEVKIAKKDE